MKKKIRFTLAETQKNISLVTFRGRGIKGEGASTRHSEGTNVTEESKTNRFFAIAHTSLCFGCRLTRLNKSFVCSLCKNDGKCHTTKQTNKSFLPSLRGGLRRGDSSFETPITKVFQKKKDITSPLTPLLKEERECKRAAFTLAETMIVLVILGIVAAITIPALVRRHVESSNRTRIRKAMTVYDTAINKMVVENGIKNNDALINEFNADKNNNSCAKSRAYFKTSQDGANDCTFRASDGVWWNISDINHPIIAFNEDDLNKADEENNKAFKLVGYLDENGSLRVSDLAKAEGDNQEYLTKLYNFVNNKKDSSSGGGSEQKSPFDECSEKGQDTCIINGITYTPKEFTAQCYTFDNDAPENLRGTQSCGTTGTFWVAELGYPEDYDTQAKDFEGSTCTSAYCKSNGDRYNAAKRYCESSGGHLPTVGELISGGYSDSDFWAAEEKDSDFAYFVFYEILMNTDKGNAMNVVCIGN